MRKIPGYPRQSLSTDGVLYRDGEPVDIFIGRDGYRQAWIFRGRKRLRHPKKIYQLMAKTYLGPRPSKKHLVRHLDGNCHNDSADNLAWGTHADNMEDLRKHSEARTPVTKTIKEEIKKEILSESPFIDHDDRVNVLTELALRYNVSFLTVNRIFWKVSAYR